VIVNKCITGEESATPAKRGAQESGDDVVCGDADTVVSSDLASKGRYLVINIYHLAM